MDDDCNYFDEWLVDKKTYNITDSKFSSSPDDPGIFDCVANLPASTAMTFYNKLLPKYKEAAKLEPKESTVEFKDGKLVLDDTIDGNSVVFYEIKY